MSPLRKNKLPKPRLQLRLVLGFLGVCLMALMSQALLFANRLVQLSQEMPAGGEELQAALGGLLLEVFLVSFAILLPCVLAVGVLLTFRVAGPIYRFELFLADVIAGRESGPCKIRTEDELQELCQLLNDALEARARRAGAEPVAAAPSSVADQQRAA